MFPGAAEKLLVSLLPVELLYHLAGAQFLLYGVIGVPLEAILPQKIRMPYHFSGETKPGKTRNCYRNCYYVYVERLVSLLFKYFPH